jgi:hypothetical protein
MEGPLPYRFIPCGRAYSNVVFDPSTQLIVAASSLKARFASYDEDGNRVWEPDGRISLDSCFVRHASLIRYSTEHLRSRLRLLESGADHSGTMDSSRWVIYLHRLKLFPELPFLPLGSSLQQMNSLTTS